MKGITSTLALLLSFLALERAYAVDWPMVQKDGAHTAFLQNGPVAPLKEDWRVETDDPEDSFTTWPVIQRGVVFASAGSGVLAVDSASGHRKWFREQEGGQGIVAPVLHADVLVIPTPDRLLGLSQATGDELWSYRSHSDFGIPTTAGGKIYVATSSVGDGGAFHSFDAVTGSLIWKVGSRFPPDTVPAVGSGKVIVTSDDVNTDQGEILALEEATGKMLWAVPAASTKSSPAILDDKVIVGGGDLFAHAFDVEGGKEIWRSRIYGRFDPQNTAAIAYGDVFLADRIGNVYRLDGRTGKKKWVWGQAQGLDPGGFSQQFPVIAGKTLYIGNGAGWLYALNVDTGRLLWKHQVGGFVYSGAVDEERFYVGVKFRNEGLYAFEHDPSGKLEPLPSKPSLAGNLFSGLVVFGLVVLAVLAASRYRRSSAR